MDFDYAIFVKNIRKNLGLTQGQLGKLVGVKRTTIGNYELGKIKPSTDVYRELQNLEATYRKIF